ncbi:MAG: hypothetical protein IJ554_01530 [Paludibacteraceae bacterium]|nr:hypothetical protein [Paludibacteraceae bacterium]MBR1381131.1 hypothetical protein [Paludibacteraceae bacterium]
MEIILTPQCKSITGGIGKRYGYFLVKRKERFFSQRSRHLVPPEGHWQFILAFAELAKSEVLVADVQVKKEELYDALTEANHWIAARSLRLPLYNARDIINLKITFSL